MVIEAASPPFDLNISSDSSPAMLSSNLIEAGNISGPSSILPSETQPKVPSVRLSILCLAAINGHLDKQTELFNQ